MKTYTPFLNLEKHDEDEFFDVKHHSDNMDKLDSAMKASDERVDVIEGKQNNLETNQGDLGALQTVNKSNLVGAMNEVFQNAADGKSQIADAISGKGGTLSVNPTFQDIADQINLTYMFEKDPNLNPDNVKAGVIIGDVNGTLKQGQTYYGISQVASISDLSYHTLTLPFNPDFFRIDVKTFSTPTKYSRAIYFREWGREPGMILDAYPSPSGIWYYSQDTFNNEADTISINITIDNWNQNWSDLGNGNFSNHFRININSSGTLSNCYISIFAYKK